MNFLVMFALVLSLATVLAAAAQECEPKCRPGRGICVSGKCLCRSPWGGSDCGRAVLDGNPSDASIRPSTQGVTAQFLQSVAPQTAHAALAEAFPGGSEPDASATSLSDGTEPAEDDGEANNLVPDSPGAEPDNGMLQHDEDSFSAQQLYDSKQDLQAKAKVRGVQVRPDDAGQFVQLVHAPAADSEPNEKPTAGLRNREVSSRTADQAPSANANNRNEEDEPDNEEVDTSPSRRIAKGALSGNGDHVAKLIEAREKEQAVAEMESRTQQTMLRTISQIRRQADRIARLEEERSRFTPAQTQGHLFAFDSNRTSHTMLLGYHTGQPGLPGADINPIAKGKSMGFIANFVDAICPFLMLAAQGLVCVCTGVCAIAKEVADWDKEDDIEIKWYCQPCAYTSLCCVGLLTDFRVLGAMICYLIFLNCGWVYLCSTGIVQQYINIVLMYAFLAFLIIGVIVMLVFCLRALCMQISIVRRFVEMLNNVSALTVWFESNYGRKFYNVMKESGQFTVDALANTKTRMQASGYYAMDKIDDFTDYIGITEPSSSDDENFLQQMKELKKKSLHPDEYYAERRHLEMNKSKTSLKKYKKNERKRDKIKRACGCGVAQPPPKKAGPPDKVPQ